MAYEFDKVVDQHTEAIKEAIKNGDSLDSIETSVWFVMDELKLALAHIREIERHS